MSSRQVVPWRGRRIVDDSFFNGVATKCDLFADGDMVVARLRSWDGQYLRQWTVEVTAREVADLWSLAARFIGDGGSLMSELQRRPGAKSRRHRMEVFRQD